MSDKMGRGWGVKTFCGFWKAFFCSKWVSKVFGFIKVRYLIFNSQKFKKNKFYPLKQI